MIIRRTLVILLAILLVFTSMPTSIFALEDDGGNPEVTEQAVMSEESGKQGDTVTLSATADEGYVLQSYQNIYGDDKSNESGNYTYRYPVYNTPGSAASGIKEWQDGTAVCTPVTNSTTTLTGGATEAESTWYVITGTVNTTNIIVKGYVNVILCDGATWNATGEGKEADNYSNPGIKLQNMRYSDTSYATLSATSPATLTIYGQTNNTGELNLTSDGNGISARAAAQQTCYPASLTVNGGKITATNVGNYGFWLYGQGNYPSTLSFTVNGGEITTKHIQVPSASMVMNGGTIHDTGERGIDVSAGSVTINGGDITVQGKIYGFTAGSMTIQGANTKIDVSTSESTSGGGGIVCNGNLLIKDVGKPVKASGTAAESSNNYGIICKGNLRIENATVEAIAINGLSQCIHAEGTIVIDHATVNAESKSNNNQAYGIHSGSTVTITNGSIVTCNAESESGWKKAYGIYANKSNDADSVSIKDSTVTATGKSTNDQGNILGYGIYGDSNRSVSITNSTVTACGIGTGSKSGYGIYGGGINITGSSKINATGSNSAGTSNGYGIRGGTNKTVSITGSDVIAAGSGSTLGHGIDGGSVTINDARVQTVGTSANSGYGIYLNGSATVSGTETSVTAEGSNGGVGRENGSEQLKVAEVVSVHQGDSATGDLELVEHQDYEDIFSKLNKKYVWLVSHQHSWSYTADGAVLTGTCSAEGHGTPNTATITIGAPAHAEYGDGLSAAAILTGSIPGVTTPSIAYSQKSGETWTVLQAAPIDAGTYKAGISLTGIDSKTATASIEYSINNASQLAPTAGKADESIKGKADGKLTGVTTEMEYRKAADTEYTPINGNEVTGLAAGTYKVRYKARDNYYVSPDQDVTIEAGKAITVSFDTNGGTLENSVVTGLSYNETVTKPAIDPTRDYSTFNGWYLDGKPFEFSTKLTDDITLKAYWILAENEDNAEGTTIATSSNGTVTKIKVDGDSGIQASGLDELAMVEKGKSENANVKIVLTAGKTEETENNRAEVTEIKNTLNETESEKGKTIELLAINLTKNISASNTFSDDSTTTKDAITDTGNTVIEVLVPVDLSGKSNIAIYRYHDDNNSVTSNVTIFNQEQIGADGSFYVEDNVIHLFTSKFSIYAIGYNTANSSGKTRYSITVADTENGQVAPDKRNATKGSTVTLTVTPNEGCTLDTLTVTDSKGNAVKLTKVNDTTYTYTMPSCKVTVSASFEKVADSSQDGECPQDETCVYAKFTDSDPKEWYHPGVHFCVEKGYMMGISEEHFAPSGTLSRGMIVTMLWRMDGSPVADYAMSFTDVEADIWYTEAIRWAQSTGVVKGYNDTSFGPENDVTREQLAAILMRYADYKGFDVSTRNDLANYTDANEISAWALENIRWANAVKMVTGRTETTLVPTGNATRAEAANMVQRFCETVLK